MSERWFWEGKPSDYDSLRSTVGGVRVLTPIGSWGCSPADPNSHGIRVSPEHAALIAAAPAMRDAIELLRSTLADIAIADDLSLSSVKRKAKRVYDETADIAAGGAVMDEPINNIRQELRALIQRVDKIQRPMDDSMRAKHQAVVRLTEALLWLQTM